jgi:hypothetical protein
MPMALWQCCLCQAQVVGDDESVATLGWWRISSEEGRCRSVCPTCRLERPSDIGQAMVGSVRPDRLLDHR